MKTTKECREYFIEKYHKGLFDVRSIYTDRKDHMVVNLLMTKACNATCPYCYQDNYDDRDSEMMSKETLDNIMKFMFSKFADDMLTFTFFGGEPLLNWETIKYCIEEYPSLKYTITTNGKLLRERQDIRETLIKHKYHVKLSFSASSFKHVYSEEPFEEAITSVMDLFDEVNGDVHYVINDANPEDLENIKALFNSNVPMVRISNARQWKTDDESKAKIIDLMKQVADFVYFGEKPMIGRCSWDHCFKSNLYATHKGLPYAKTPPTHCGCGYAYSAIDMKGDIFPCDNFAFFKEWKIGDVYNGFDENAMFFTKISEWLEALYRTCDDCEYCTDNNFMHCPRALCLTENYVARKHPFVPAETHCETNYMEDKVYNYIITRAIDMGIDEEIRKYVWNQ